VDYRHVCRGKFHHIRGRGEGGETDDMCGRTKEIKHMQSQNSSDMTDVFSVGKCRIRGSGWGMMWVRGGGMMWVGGG
jgi:hypothetical protein